MNPMFGDGVTPEDQERIMQMMWEKYNKVVKQNKDMLIETNAWSAVEGENIHGRSGLTGEQIMIMLLLRQERLLIEIVNVLKSDPLADKEDEDKPDWL